MPRPTDTIFIRDLKVTCIVGTRRAERTQQRHVLLNLTLFCDLSCAGQTDELRHTVDYAAVSHRVTTMVSRSRYQLLERLAQEVANTCLAFPGVAGVTVTLDKPGAVRGARSMAVEITRSRKR
jgi:dihydroneopterin aldolase/D-erythro-7,8-dihydroneopterin triphosphate epimerase